VRAFRYRLAGALRRAEHVEQTLQAELAHLQRELAALVHRWEGLRRREVGLQRRLRELQAPPGGAAPARAYAEVELHRVEAARRELEGVGALLERAADLRRAMEEHLEATRERLVEASRARRTLENHRDDLAQRHRRAEQAKATRQLDELATMGFARELTREGEEREAGLGEGLPMGE